MRVKFLYGDTDENNQLVLPEGYLTVDIEKKAVRIHDGVTPGGYEVIGEQAVEMVSGPGPQELIAVTDDDGFYGEVSGEELITTTQLSLQVGLSAGVVTNEDPGWLKFKSGEKVLFFAKKPLRHGVSANQLYAAELVKPGKIIDINGWRYLVRLPTGADTDPSSLARQTLDPPETVNSEWNRLLLSVYAGNGNRRHWAAYTDEELGGEYVELGAYCWVQERHTDPQQTQCGRGPATGNKWDLSYFSSTQPSLSSWQDMKWGWRPVLELVAE